MISKVLILTEAGKDIGFGHYTRCSALQQAFKTDGVMVDMMVYLNDIGIDDNHIIKTNWLADLTSVQKANGCSIVIVDSYLASEEIYLRLKTIFDRVIAIDDYNRIPYPATLVLNPNVFFNDIDYSNQTAPCMGGKEFVILRPEFRKAKWQAPTNETIKEILVTLGGSDFRKLHTVIIQTCLETEVPAITIIAPEGISSADSNQRLTVLPAQNSTSMCQLLQRADVVVSACGQTLHELACLGKATIGICLDIDQIPNQQYYLRHGFLPADMQWNDPDISKKIKFEIASYSPLEKRTGIALNSPGLIDKNGVTNIISVLKNA